MTPQDQLLGSPPSPEPHSELNHKLELASHAVNAQQSRSGEANNPPTRPFPKDAAELRSVYPGVCASPGLGGGGVQRPL